MLKPPSITPQQLDTQNFHPLNAVQQQYSQPPVTQVVAAPLPSHELESFKIEDSISDAKRKMKRKKKELKSASKKSLLKRAVYKAQNRCERCGHKETGDNKKIIDGRCEQHRREFEKAKNESEAAERMYHKTKSHKELDFEYVVQNLTDNLNAAPIDMGDIQHEIEKLVELRNAVDKQLGWKFLEANR